MSLIKQVNIDHIIPNHHRNLDQYPWIEGKVSALQRSIDDVGLWEGIIAREVGTRYELAFGHHRLEAAKRCGLKKVPVIVRDLSDEDMLRFMGRENGEDYSAEFLVMLNTWEAAVNSGHGRKNAQAVEYARILGWLGKDGQANNTARACSNAHKLISDGYMKRDELSGLTVRSVKQIVDRAQQRMGQLQRLGKTTNRPKAEIEKAKHQVARGAKVTAKKAASGRVSTNDLSSSVDAEAHKAATRSKTKQSPLFGVFGKALADGIEKMLSTDSASTKLRAIVDGLDKLTMAEDEATVRRVDFQLGELRTRAEKWQTRLTRDKIVPISAAPALEKLP
jgi:ParB-like chromosome segregation protein Spo0J